MHTLHSYDSASGYGKPAAARREPEGERATMATREGRVTAKDVARAAGVSQSTVSYVLNNTANQTISAATRSRVLAAVEELGYAPSAAARALRTGTSSTVMIVLPDAPVGATIAQLIEVVSDALDPHGYTVLFRRHRGAELLEHGEDGKKRIFSGLAIAAAPWLAFFALNLSGFWDALGLKLI